MTSITSLGLGSGLDLEGLISSLVSAEGTPTVLRITQQEAEYQAELSAIGSFRSALDTFNQALDALNDLANFNQRVIRSSNEALFTVTGDENAVATVHDVEVIRLAQAHKLSSGPLPSGEAVVGTGSLTLAIGDAEMTLEIDAEHGTLEEIRDAINDAEDNPGVQASIVNGEDGAHLVLSSAETGEDNAITVTTSGGDGGLSALVYDPLGGTTNLSEVQEAIDAELRIDGILVHSASNSVGAALEGVTIDLVSASPGETARLEVELDVAGTRDAIENFVHTYNALQSTLGDLTAYDPTTETGGPLLGDSLVLLFQDQLRREIGESVTKFTFEFDSLVDLGLTTNLDDGTLEIDNAVLDEQLSQNFDKVSELFAGENGYAVRIQALAESYLDSDGLIDVRTDGLQKSIDGLEDDLVQLDEHLAAYEARLRDQFTALDLLISELTATSEFLSQQLALLPSFDTTSA